MQIPRPVMPGALPQAADPDAGGLYPYLDKLHGAGAPTGPAPAAAPAAAAAKPASTGKPKPAPSASPRFDTSGAAILGAYNQFAGRPVLGSIYADGGSIHSRVPVMLSPGERVVPPGTSPGKAAQMVESGAARRVPGKAKVEGDSPKNDTVHATLEPGSIVIPRSVVNAADAGAKAKSFVESVLRRGGRAAGGVVDYSGGGLVEGEVDASDAPPTPAPKPKTGTARGVAGARTRGRIKRTEQPLPEVD